MRNQSGPITSTRWPMAVSSAITADKVRTTPFTWGCQASETIRTRMAGPARIGQAASAAAGSRGVKNDSLLTAAQSNSSSRPSWCSTRAVQLSTQSPSFR